MLRCSLPGEWTPMLMSIKIWGTLSRSEHSWSRCSSSNHAFFPGKMHARLRQTGRLVQGEENGVSCEWQFPGAASNPSLPWCGNSLSGIAPSALAKAMMVWGMLERCRGALPACPCPCPARATSHPYLQVLSAQPSTSSP